MSEAFMTKASDPWYLAQRAEQLATVLLTRIEKISVARSSRDEGLDLLATITNGHAGGRMFGVEVKGSLDINDLIETDGTIRKALAQSLIARLGEYPFPVAVMLFGMQADDGYFGWVLAPSPQIGTATPTLQTPSPLRAERITDDLLRRAVREVEDWYDARRRKAS